jgi:segregation and condensation protein A
MSYYIKSEQFEGPLDLLLELTREQKLDITRFSLARITDQYLEYISSEKSISLENLSEFLSVAAKLILIKSKALLPLLELTEEEEEEIKDLEFQLAEYKKFKDIAKEVEKLSDARKISFSRESFLGMQSVFYPPENLTANDLAKAFNKLLGDIPVLEKIEEEMIKEVLTLEEKITHLHEVLRQKVETSFAEVVVNAKDKVEVVVSFLAMLEMVKQRIIHVEQVELFSDIRLKHKSAVQNNQQSN